jgi:hypothetical protein
MSYQAWLTFCHIESDLFSKKLKVTDIFETPFDLIPGPVSFPSTPEVATLLRLPQHGILSIHLCICCLSQGTEVLEGRDSVLLSILFPASGIERSSDLTGGWTEGWMGGQP